MRVDFDDAGIHHVNAILGAASSARPWRMTVAEYQAGLADGVATVPLRVDRLALTPWDPPLAEVMRLNGVAVFEEAFLEALVEDLKDSQ